MLVLGKEKVRKTGVVGPAIDLIRGDAMRLPLVDASIDAVTIGFGIRNVEEPAIACREIARVLRPGGKLVILEFSLPRTAVVRSFYLWYFRRVLPRIGRAISRHPSAYTYLPASVEAFPSPDAFGQLLRDCGFSAVRTVPAERTTEWAESLGVTRRRSYDRRGAAAGHHFVGFRCATSEDLGEVAPGGRSR